MPFSFLQNKQLGQNLHLHPCNFVSSIHKEDIRPWEGGIITSVTTEFENLDEKGHGVKLEPTCMVVSTSTSNGFIPSHLRLYANGDSYYKQPYVSLALTPWGNAADTKMRMLKYRHANSFIALTRDRDSGSVFPDPVTGEPRINYNTSDFDRAHTLEGVQAIAKLCYVSGATEIRASLPALEAFIVSDGGEKQRNHPDGKDPEFTDPAFAKWLQRVREISNAPPYTGWSSAHQMGTCRMAVSADKGVVNQDGQVWGKEGLYVCDASVFPSASGVNPMLTTLSISDWISRQLVKELAA